VPAPAAIDAPRVVLISTYDLGHQPFALGSLAAWLRREGAAVSCNDLAVEALDTAALAGAALIAVHLAMHTATRIAIEIMPRIRAANPRAPVVLFGLYAAANFENLRSAGAAAAIGGEFEAGVVELYRRVVAGETIAAAARVDRTKHSLLVPERDRLPPLSAYASLIVAGGRRVVAYTEASRGCKHTCRHCPVVPVYGGRFRIVPLDVVMADIAQQVAAGARHVSFGDPDFLNGPKHALAVVRGLNREFPEVGYDIVTKVEHLLKHGDMLPELAATGCNLITTAAESVDDRVLAILDKGHTRADFHRAVALVRAANIALSPTFVPFTPWTTLAGYRDLLADLATLDLIEDVAPVQLAIRLLLPRGSRLLDRPEMRRRLGAFDAAALSYAWQPADVSTVSLHRTVERIAADGEDADLPRRRVFEAIWAVTHDALGVAAAPLPAASGRAGGPRMTEAWFCCAEPTSLQRQRVTL
jgi:radical SAM superfamily enzyme YgiQ (UPF0313 family)